MARSIKGFSMYGKVKRQVGLKSRKHSSESSLHLTIIYHRSDELTPDPANPRCHSKRQVQQIGNSISAFGLNVPILIDGDNNVIAGHGRLLACGELGITEVPTLRLDHLTPAQARAFMIADNRLTEISAWDDRLLAQQLKELSLLGLDFDIEATGFEMGEICGLPRSKNCRKPTPTRQMCCRRFRPAHRSARSAMRADIAERCSHAIRPGQRRYCPDPLTSASGPPGSVLGPLLRAEVRGLAVQGEPRA